MNKTPSAFDRDKVAERVRVTYGCEVAAVLPHSDDQMRLGSEGDFSIRNPEHELTAMYRTLADRIVPERSP